MKSYFNTTKLYELAVSNKIQAITKTLSLQIKGESHLYLINKYKEKDDIKKNIDDEVYSEIRNKLNAIKELNGLKSTIYTMVIDSSTLKYRKPTFRFIVASSDVPFYMHPFSSYPDEELKLFKVGAVLPAYSDENGTWISSFSPIKTKSGKVVGIVQCDVAFDEYISEAKWMAIKQLVIIPFVILLMLLVVNIFLKGIIEREKIVEQLRNALKLSDEAKEEAIVALDTQSLFLAKVSHEMRTPLNGIIGLSHLIDKSKLSIDEQSSFQSIIDSGKGLLLIINDLLDVSKVESGNLDLEALPFDLKHALNSGITLLETSIKGKKIDFEFVFDDQISQTLIGDRFRINQVVVNLLSNAFKFTTYGGAVSLRVQLIDAYNQKNKIRIIVKDSGIGIAKDKIESIFENFKQADEGTTRKFGGTGLGLSISKHIVELHDSELKVNSVIGVGSEFYFEIDLPISKKVVLKKTSSDLSSKTLNNISVLVAEDNTVNQKIAKNILVKYGASVSVVENGKLAIEAVNQGGFDIVLMDIQMPVMGGEESTFIIRNGLNSDIPIIALTANAIKGDKEKFMSSGMNGYLSKPFDPDELILCMLSLLSVKPIYNSEPVENQEVEEDSVSLFDLSVLRSLAGGDEDFVKDIVITFVNQCDDYLALLKTHVDNESWADLGRSAHKFNSSVDAIGIIGGKEILKTIELNCKEEKNISEIKELVKEITSISIQVKNSIIKHYS